MSEPTTGWDILRNSLSKAYVAADIDAAIAAARPRIEREAYEKVRAAVAGLPRWIDQDGDEWFIRRRTVLAAIGALMEENDGRCAIEPAFSQHEYAVNYCETHDRQHVIEGLVRAYDIVKPEPGMDGPHGGHIGGPSRQKAALAIDAAIEALAAPAVTETDPIDAYVASPEAVEQLARSLQVAMTDTGRSVDYSPLANDLLTALRKIRADD